MPPEYKPISFLQQPCEVDAGIPVLLNYTGSNQLAKATWAAGKRQSHDGISGQFQRLHSESFVMGEALFPFRVSLFALAAWNLCSI